MFKFTLTSLGKTYIPLVFNGFLAAIGKLYRGRDYQTVGVFSLQMDSPSYDIYRLNSLLRSVSEPSPRTDVTIHGCV